MVGPVDHLRRLLFVDDDEDLLLAMKMTVRQRPCCATFVTGGGLALRLLSEAAFDVVVTDWHMPGIDGVQVLEHVRSHFPHIVRVLLSSQADASALVHTTGLAHECFLKPHDRATLGRIVDRACGLIVP